MLANYAGGTSENRHLATLHTKGGTVTNGPHSDRIDVKIDHLARIKGA